MGGPIELVLFIAEAGRYSATIMRPIVSDVNCMFNIVRPWADEKL